MVDLHAPVYLVKGSDESLLRDAVVDLVHALVGDGDRTLMVDELDLARYGAADGELSLAPLADAAQTPPFLTDRRVVVGRELAAFGTKEAVAPVVAYLADPLPSTSLVLAWEPDPRPGTRNAAVPRSLADAVKAAGGLVIDSAPQGRGRQRADWVGDRAAEAGVRLERPALDLLAERLEADPGRLRSVLASLAAAYPPGQRLDVAAVEPYLGEGGDLPPWELTDAIDRGDAGLALDRLARMVGAGRHPLQIMATLHGHYERMLRLDGAGVGDEKAAAELLGIKGSTFPARKALESGRRLGRERLHEFVGLLAAADLELRGARAWPPELVVEVLVARLASRSRARSGARR